ncbi:YceD family protein [Sansalvadorimonas sp. 2012CJ34-2]|uniref:Large ribosomal RNA subunit accumulation protein YceD n=1 Tax=Parendozoicomonas callyspongiae TaxID=2942213 RepID=A0ABT0PBJ7_9GAMM|nr:YceD family protein [Sansalvadorimonas sp. 2012CJ34-2]MCL6268752.1 YceD family protein [Sansalvadorimonas sp. 2012CJ34-2]
MYTGQLPKHISPRKLAMQDAVIEGVLPVASCERLRDVLADDQDNVRVVLRFSVDEQRRPLIQGELEGELGMICQRCLEVAKVQISASVNVAMVLNEDQARNLPGYLDPLLVEDEAVDLQPFLEEEILLNLPIVAYHENESCHSGQAAYSTLPSDSAEAEATVEVKRPNPFSVLADLKAGK